MGYFSPRWKLAAGGAPSGEKNTSTAVLCTNINQSTEAPALHTMVSVERRDIPKVRMQLQECMLSPV